jgi:hypothetical protein
MRNAAFRLVSTSWRQASTSTCSVTIVITLLTNATLPFYDLHQVKGRGIGCSKIIIVIF